MTTYSHQIGNSRRLTWLEPVPVNKIHAPLSQSSTVTVLCCPDYQEYTRLFWKNQIDNSRWRLRRGNHASHHLHSVPLVLRAEEWRWLSSRCRCLATKSISRKPLAFISRIPVCSQYCFYTYLQRKGDFSKCSGFGRIRFTAWLLNCIPKHSVIAKCRARLGPLSSCGKVVKILFSLLLSIS